MVAEFDRAQVWGEVTTGTELSPGSEAVTRLTAGFGFGPEWGINRHFHVFLQPGGRYVFAENHGYRFLALQAETGVRYTF